MTLTRDERRSAAVLRMENARATLADARLMLASGSIRSAANRAYYAMFYAATALAVAKGVVLAKHHGVLAFIHKECVQSGDLAREHGRALQKAFEDRSEGDYQDILKLKAQDVAHTAAAAERFIDAVEPLVSAALAVTSNPETPQG